MTNVRMRPPERLERREVERKKKEVKRKAETTQQAQPAQVESLVEQVRRQAETRRESMNLGEKVPLRSREEHPEFDLNKFKSEAMNAAAKEGAPFAGPLPAKFVGKRVNIEDLVPKKVMQDLKAVDIGFDEHGQIVLGKKKKEAHA